MLLGKSSAYRQILASDKIEARLVLAALYLLLLLPVAMVFSRTAAEIAAGLISLLFLARSFRARDWRWLREAPVLIALVLWVYSLLIVTPFALDPAASFSRVDWIRFIPFFAAVAYWLSGYHRELWRVALGVFILLLLAGADALYQYYFGVSLISGIRHDQPRLTGPFNKFIIGIYLAKMSLPVLGILLYYAWVGKKRWLKIGLLLALVYFFAVIMLSNERAATFTFALGMLLLAFGFFIVFRRARRAILCTLAALAILVVAAYQSQPILEKHLHLTRETLQNFSDSDYAQLWKASILLWQEHPVTGVGMLNFRTACPKLLEEGRVLYCDNHSHNLYLEVLSEFGTLGFVLLLILVVSLITAVIEQHDAKPRERAILTFFAAAGLLINFFPVAPTQSFFSNWPALLAWQSIAWSLAIARGGKGENHA